MYVVRIIRCSCITPYARFCFLWSPCTLQCTNFETGTRNFLLQICLEFFITSNRVLVHEISLLNGIKFQAMPARQTLILRGKNCCLVFCFVSVSETRCCIMVCHEFCLVRCFSNWDDSCFDMCACSQVCRCFLFKKML